MQGSFLCKVLSCFFITCLSDFFVDWPCYPSNIMLLHKYIYAIFISSVVDLRIEINSNVEATWLTYVCQLN